MNYGIVICSKCNREVHQHWTSDDIAVTFDGWYHCEDKSSLCQGATMIYLGGENLPTMSSQQVVLGE